ncbi:MAG: helix-turn-helix domain-containing protein [Christensenellaceae bacterium]|nr:helix-turn-helix domain-containing protein [Christensenellaceae bacterium]
MIRKKVGNRIRELRQAQNISQEKLALKADIDRTYLASVEQGKRNIAIVNLEKIVMALDTTLEVFFKGL